jgi:hypothetical protein
MKQDYEGISDGTWLSSSNHIERKKSDAKYYPEVQGRRSNEKQNPSDGDSL